MSNSYPKREACFAFKFCRLLSNSGGAVELGPEAYCLLTVIAMAEDGIRYSRAIAFYNEPLQKAAGLASYGRLKRARDKAVRLGWLHYEAGGKSRPGHYWVTVPADIANINDVAILDEETEAERESIRAARELGIREGQRIERERVKALISSHQMSLPFGLDEEEEARPEQQDGSREITTQNGGRSETETKDKRNDVEVQTRTFQPLPVPKPKPSMADGSDDLDSGDEQFEISRILKRLRAPADLEDTVLLVEIHHALGEAAGCPVLPTEDDRISVVALAEHCLRSDKNFNNPVGLFVSRVRKRDFDKLTLDERDRGNERLKQLVRRADRRGSRVESREQPGQDDQPESLAESLQKLVSEQLVAEGAK